MKNIVIFAGGHGGIKLQQSIAKYAGNNVNVDIIISAYDNAKSTLACRKVFDNKLLGISDLRKNHITQYAIQHDMNDEIEKFVYDWLEYRTPKQDYDNVEGYALAKEYIANYYEHTKDKEGYELFKKAVDNFFIKDDNWRMTTKSINFKDFALSNILYSSIANMHSNSMNIAGTIMANILGIKDNVHTISDTNGWLYGITESGIVLDDEDIISQWDNFSDRIEDIYVVDEFGNKIPTIMDENPSECPPNICKNLIDNADIIILSSGSQWTSLIPTYLFDGVNDAIKSNKHAKKYVIMNNIEDKDLTGCDSNWILSKINKYIDLRDFVCVYNENAVDLLKYKQNDIINYPIIGVISDSPGARYHNLEMFKYILLDYFKEYIESDTFIFDFDGTSYASSTDALSILNLILYSKLKSRYILSGNYWLHFDNIVNKYTYSNSIVNWESIFDNLYCSFGAVHCIYKDGIVFNNYTTNEFDITKYFEKFCLELRDNVNIESNYFVDNRSGVNFAIRPLKNREELLPKIQKFVKEFNERYNCNLIAEINGKTTIDILHADYNKRSAIDYILPEEYSFENVTYVGDSFNNGNDECLVGYKHIKCFSVEDIYDTNLLLNTILSNEAKQ